MIHFCCFPIFDFTWLLHRITALMSFIIETTKFTYMPRKMMILQLLVNVRTREWMRVKLLENIFISVGIFSVFFVGHNKSKLMINYRLAVKIFLVSLVSWHDDRQHHSRMRIIIAFLSFVIPVLLSVFYAELVNNFLTFLIEKLKWVERRHLLLRPDTANHRPSTIRNKKSIIKHFFDSKRNLSHIFTS